MGFFKDTWNQTGVKALVVFITATIIFGIGLTIKGEQDGPIILGIISFLIALYLLIYWINWKRDN